MLLLSPTWPTRINAFHACVNIYTRLDSIEERRGAKRIIIIAAVAVLLLLLFQKEPSEQASFLTGKRGETGDLGKVKHDASAKIL